MESFLSVNTVIRSKNFPADVAPSEYLQGYHEERMPYAVSNPVETIALLLFWFFCFRHRAWKKGWHCKIPLFLAPFVFGCLLLWLDIHYLSLEVLRRWHDAICCFSTLVALLLLPQWYKLMWLALLALPVHKISDSAKLMFTILFSIVMVLTIIFFFHTLFSLAG